MNRLTKQLLASVGWLSAALPAVSQEVSVTSCEYWIDRQFDSRKSVALSGEWDASIDVSALPVGMHTLGLRIADSKGRWSAPVTRYFLQAGQRADGNGISVYELWTDGDFANRMTGSTENGTAALEPDFRQLHTGMHSLTFRLGDTGGRWSAPVTRYFIVTGAPYGDNTVETLSYWIDGDTDRAVTVRPDANGIISIEPDTRALAKGMHSLSYQPADSRGRHGQPATRFFVVPDTLPAGNRMTAYAYWFNHGPRTRVDVSPANPMVLSDLWIEIKDVVPNNIPAGYRFAPEEATAWCDDNVTFGLEAYDDAGRSTQAVMSDTMRMTVPVRLDITALKDNTPETFAAPGRGRISAFSMAAEAGDSLVWTVGGACECDVYDENGQRAEWRHETDGEGRQTLSMRATGPTTYVLLHHASAVVPEMDITCTRKSQASGIGTPAAGLTVSASKGQINVECGDGGRLHVTGMAGMTAFNGYVAPGSTGIAVSPGTYLLRWNGTPAGKMLVP